MAARSLLLLLFVSSLLLLQFTTVTSSASQHNDDDDEDLSFLEDSDDSVSSHPPHHEHADFDAGEFNDGEEDFGNFDPESYEGEEEDEPMSAVDEKDVVVLKEGNFSEFIEKNKHVMVEFYAPWCGHCKSLAPEYAAAATQLKEEEEDVKLAKVDATEENELAQKYDVQGFPTVLFFIDGLHKPYSGQRHKDAIVSWIKKKTGPAVQNLTTTEEAEKILADDKTVVLAFLDSLVDRRHLAQVICTHLSNVLQGPGRNGDASKEFAAASKVEDDVTFYQTASPDVAKLFHIDPKSKLPSLVLLKKEAEKVSVFGADDQFSKSAIVDFIFVNKLPLVNIFTRENAPSIFENPIKKQILLFATSKDSEKYLPIFQEAAKSFKGKLIFVYVEVDNEDIGTPVSEYFGVSGDGPNVLAYSGNDDNRKFMLDGEVTEENIKVFCQGFLEDKLKPFYKSDPIPEINDGDVKIVVGNNFDEIVLDESKDVLLEIYAPWCGHCQALEPIYNKLAKHLSSVDSLVIAKMDGTTNEHPRAKADGFPTILFFPAGNKSFEPITVDVDRTVVAFYKFLKKNASIPFKLQKPAASTTQKTESAEDAADTNVESTASTKDEL